MPCFETLAGRGLQTSSKVLLAASEAISIQLGLADHTRPAGHSSRSEDEIVRPHSHSSCTAADNQNHVRPNHGSVCARTPLSHRHELNVPDEDAFGPASALRNTRPDPVEPLVSQGFALTTSKPSLPHSVPRRHCRCLDIKSGNFSKRPDAIQIGKSPGRVLPPQAD